MNHLLYVIFSIIEKDQMLQLIFGVFSQYFKYIPIVVLYIIVNTSWKVSV